MVTGAGSTGAVGHIIYKIIKFSRNSWGFAPCDSLILNFSHLQIIEIYQLYSQKKIKNSVQNLDSGSRTSTTVQVLLDILYSYNND